MAETEQSDVAALTVQLLSAYLANNTVAHTDIAELVRTTRAALIEETKPASVESEAPTYTPAVSVRRSLASPDHIISLIDGKPYKTLKRHLTSNGLTPEGYRTRYNLPVSYPMVAPGFAQQRRAIAEKIGLGRRPAAQPTAPDENVNRVKEKTLTEKPAAAAAAKKPRNQRVAKALATSTSAGDEVAPPPTPKRPSKASAPKAEVLNTAGSEAAVAISAAAKKPAGKPVVKGSKAAKPDVASLVKATTDLATPKADEPAKVAAETIPATKAADKPVKKQASTPAKAAPGASAKAKPTRDRLGLFREVAEAAAAREIKKVKGKNGPVAKAAEPAPSDDTVDGPTLTADSTASDV